MRMVKEGLGFRRFWLPPRWKDKDCPYEKRNWMNWYQEYLSSEEWAYKRVQVLGLAGWLCQECGVRSAKEVHHIDYTDVGDEDYGQLLAVCGLCHQSLHGHY